jgi:hypothetical protein
MAMYNLLGSPQRCHLYIAASVGHPGRFCCSHALTCDTFDPWPMVQTRPARSESPLPTLGHKSKIQQRVSDLHAAKGVIVVGVCCIRCHITTTQ